MCDVMVALPDATHNGGIVFGKNSDRPIDDCQVLYSSSGAGDEGDGQIRCSYVEVPQASKPLATIGCRPYWCWGYETGMNEAGVVAGNTAIFTRSLWIDRGRQPLGLTGMDLLRLGLERGRTAEEFVHVVAELLAEYGQWGSGVPAQDHEAGSYDNAFLVADQKEAWLVETSGRRWIAERITSGVRSLSNEPTIRTEWTTGSDDIRQFAGDMGWWRGGEDEFDFALCYGDHEHYSRQVSHIRWKRTTQMLNERKGSVDVRSMMIMLRDHYEDTFLNGPQFHPFLPDFHTVCMHDSPAGFTWGNTATSVVVEIQPKHDETPVYWTAYTPPCCSVYVPYTLDAPLPEAATAVGTAGLKVTPADKASIDTIAPNSLWWRARRIVDAAAEKPTSRPAEIRAAFDPIESDLLANAGAHPGADFIQSAVARVTSAIETLEEKWRLQRV